VRRDLERGLNPFLALLPRYLFASALASQFVALVVALPALRDVARVVLGLAVLVGLVALSVLAVDFVSSPVGSRAHRLRGMASGWTSVLVVGFTLAWYVSAETTPGFLFGIELVAFAGGAFGHWGSLRQMPGADGEDDEEEVSAFGQTDGWPFRHAR
jgi:hypothetical protein